MSLLLTEKVMRTDGVSTTGTRHCAPVSEKMISDVLCKYLHDVPGQHRCEVSGNSLFCYGDFSPRFK